MIASEKYRDQIQPAKEKSKKSLTTIVITLTTPRIKSLKLHKQKVTIVSWLGKQI